MNRFAIPLLAWVAFSAGAGTAVAQTRVVAYLQLGDDPASLGPILNYSKITDLDLAFENPTDDQGNLSYHPVNDALIKAAHAHHVKVLVSIGGGDASSDSTLMTRYFALQSNGGRAAFVSKLASYLVEHDLDGIDVDLEGPSIGPDYGSFITDLALALKPKRKLLTAALSQGYGGDKIPDAALANFDYLNIMAYDDTGPWAPNRPGQHSSMEMMQRNVAYWLGRGVPKAKAIVGVPFYGYGFGAAFNQGGYTYAQILAAYPGAEKLDQVGNTIWYNGIPTISAKAKYVKDQGLGGVMIWSIDQDVPGPKSLLTALFSALHQ